MKETTNGTGRLTVAMISEVFWQPDGADRLTARLREAKEAGADLAVLPEIPLNPWSPATKDARDDDAEPMDGPRARAQADAAREAGIGLVGGIIHRDPVSGRRTSRALVLDAQGRLLATYEKLHLPEEEGFWETSHYEPGSEAPQTIEGLGLPIGVQLCSDANRPVGSHLLGAQGAVAIFNPRASERRTLGRWMPVWRANALTSACYVLSVNRPEAEGGVDIGGPSVAFDPNGELLVETTDGMALVTLDARVAAEARTAYPGYLAIHAGLYADAWAKLAGANTGASTSEELIPQRA